MNGPDLVLRQERGAVIRVTEQGSVSLRVPLDEPRAGGRGFDPMKGMIIIEEAVQQRLDTTLKYAAGVLDLIDRTQRLTHLVVAARLSGVEHRGWSPINGHDPAAAWVSPAGNILPTSPT